MADRYKKINIYDMYPNSGELELGANTQNPTASANFTNRTALDNSYFDAMVGGSYQPMNEQNTINPRVGLGMGSGNLNINALMDEYRKTAGAEYGPVYANITQTENDLIKQLGLQGQNFGANITNSNQGTGYNVGYGNQLTDDSRVNFDFSKSPDGSYISQLMYELGF